MQARSRREERKLAKRWGGKRQPASGSRPGYKGDVKLDDFLIEDKFTDKRSFRLQLETLFKIHDEAAAYGRQPVLRLNFMRYGVCQGPMIRGANFVVISQSLFEEITGLDKEEG